jgi:imidazolonepropionase-like amidohydrolase
MIGASGKWVCPTLIVHENIQKHPDDPNLQLDYEHYVDKDTRTFWRQALTNGESEFELQKKLAKVMFDSGAKLLTGTDCLNSYVLAGFSLHEELQELVSAGLPEFEVLKGSTVSAAEFLKRKQDIGTIEVGKIADLILLEGNPLENILNTKRINGVMVKGKWFTADELDTMLADIRGSISN